MDLIKSRIHYYVKRGELISLISYQTRTVEIDGKIFSFREVKDKVLTNNIGLINMGTYVIASKERAFLDAF